MVKFHEMLDMRTKLWPFQEFRLQEYTWHLGTRNRFARCAFNAHAHAIIAKQMDLAVEAGAIFVEIASGFISDEAENLLTKL